MALTREEIDQIADAVAKRQGDAMVAAFKLKFELMFGVDCTDEDQRDDSRAAFKWLLNLDRAKVDRNLEFVDDLRGGVARGRERLWLWVLGLLNTAAIAAIGWAVTEARNHLK